MEGFDFHKIMERVIVLQMGFSKITVLLLCNPISILRGYSVELRVLILKLNWNRKAFWWLKKKKLARHGAAPGRLRQKDLEFEASLGYIVKSCLKTTKNNQKKHCNKTNHTVKLQSLKQHHIIIEIDKQFTRTE
jgi:hypothetical protein